MKKYLSGAQKDFFSLVRAATFVNPFGDERLELDLKLIGSKEPASEADRIRILSEKVHESIRSLETDGQVHLDSFAAQARPLMETVFLFDFFHQFLDRFDPLILEQTACGEKSVRVSFYKEAHQFLEQRGFPLRRIPHYFALCYQLRRAFFFIRQSLIGRSPCMKALRRDLWNNVFTHDIGLYNTYMWNRMEDFSTLILGETGTGKGTSAMSIGRSGFIPFDEKSQSFAESFVRSFVSLNLSQFPETLMESELFGHRKGAFTGAVEDFRGIFDRCSPYGSIFLDEIGEISEPVQIKLLQVLQERTFCPVGSHQQRRFRGRVIGATNRRPDELRESRLLRDDFYYRLCSDIITVPPLRLRIREDPAELDDLLEHTIGRIIGSPSEELFHMIRQSISENPGKGYLWPGNVRELEQCVRRILLKRRYEGDYPASGPDILSELSGRMKQGDMDISTLLAGYCNYLYGQLGTYMAVAQKTGLDRRTAKKYSEDWQNKSRKGEHHDS